VDAEPVDAEPVDAEPVDTEPVDAEPVDAEPVDAKPDLTLKEGQCLSQKDCKNAPMCVAIDAPQMCGICFSPPPSETCNDDAPCKAQDPDTLCKTVTCPCSGEKTCQPGCTLNPSQCEVWEVCDPDGHCKAMSCATDGDCLPSFECAGGSCKRKSCKGNSDCPLWCVKGGCYAEPGNCMYPPP
jgi:hypothetical protein